MKQPDSVRDCEIISKYELKTPKPIERLFAGNAEILVYQNAEDMGLASAISIASRQCALVDEQGETSLMLMAAPSAFYFYESYIRIAHLSKALQNAINRTHYFRFDDYLLPVHHPASFQRLLCKHFFFELEDYCDPDKIHNFDTESPDIEKAAKDYERSIIELGPDLQLKGMGENGHWGFHEPGIPIDGEPRFMRVQLSKENVDQQMRDHPNLYHTPGDVPKEAYTANVPLFMMTRYLIEDNVPQPSKAFAVLAAYGNEMVDAAIPGSALKTHHNPVVRTTQAAAWALLEYRKRGAITTEILHILAQSLSPKEGRRWKEIAQNIRKVMDKMEINLLN